MQKQSSKDQDLSGSQHLSQIKPQDLRKQLAQKIYVKIKFKLNGERMKQFYEINKFDDLDFVWHLFLNDKIVEGIDKKKFKSINFKINEIPNSELSFPVIFEKNCTIKIMNDIIIESLQLQKQTESQLLIDDYQQQSHKKGKKRKEKKTLLDEKEFL